MNLKTKPIEKIGNDVFAINFKKAERLGIELFADNGRNIKYSSAAVSKSGDLYINNCHKDYQVLKAFYMLLDSATTDDLIKIYKLYDSRYPDCNSFEDIDKYSDETARAGAMNKVLLKIELIRREYKINKTQTLLNLLFH